MKRHLVLMALLVSTGAFANQGAQGLTQQSQAQQMLQGQIAKGGEGGSVGDTTLSVNTKHEGNVAAIFAGEIPTTLHSCRLYMFGGGGSTSGNGAGTIPLGNDQTCLSVVSAALMQKVGGFTQAEVTAVVCRIEGMSKLDTCKNLSKK